MQGELENTSLAGSVLPVAVLHQWERESGSQLDDLPSFTPVALEKDFVTLSPTHMCASPQGKQPSVSSCPYIHSKAHHLPQVQLWALCSFVTYALKFKLTAHGSTLSPRLS